MQTALTTALMGFFLLSGTSSAAFSGFGSTVSDSTTPTYTVAMTGYNAVEAQTDSTPDVTASGAFSNPEVIAARSVDLADELPFGTVIEIAPNAATSSTCGLSVVRDRIGLRVIADSMHPRKHDQIDVLFDSTGTHANPAKILGVCKDVQIRVVGQVDIKKMPRSQAELKRVVDAQRLAISK